MLSVLTIDLERGLPAVDTDAVMTGGETVYASPSSLYVATERWAGRRRGRRRRLDGEHRDPPLRHLRSRSATTYAGSGAVDGYMLSQWSMSEHEGVLRVASTSSPPWLPDGASGGERELRHHPGARRRPACAEVGRLGGIGRGEQIYAVRFIGASGYVVTFRQVDPLHVIDLADPAEPRLAGELEIPGYSAYLHPVGPGLLLGIGQDASADGDHQRRAGLAVRRLRPGATRCAPTTSRSAATARPRSSTTTTRSPGRGPRPRDAARSTPTLRRARAAPRASGCG